MAGKGGQGRAATLAVAERRVRRRNVREPENGRASKRPLRGQVKSQRDLTHHLLPNPRLRRHFENTPWLFGNGRTQLHQHFRRLHKGIVVLSS